MDTNRKNNSYSLLSTDETEAFVALGLLLLYVHLMNDLTRSNIITRQEGVSNQSTVPSCSLHIK